MPHMHAAAFEVVSSIGWIRLGTHDEDTGAMTDAVIPPITFSYRVRGSDCFDYAHQDFTLRSRTTHGMGASEPTKLRAGNHPDFFL